MNKDQQSFLEEVQLLAQYMRMDANDENEVLSYYESMKLAILIQQNITLSNGFEDLKHKLLHIANQNKNKKDIIQRSV